MVISDLNKQYQKTGTNFPPHSVFKVMFLVIPAEWRNISGYGTYKTFL